MPIHRDHDDTFGWDRGVSCLTVGCENSVTFPDFESYCTACQLDQQRRASQHDEAYEAGIRRWFQKTDVA